MVETSDSPINGEVIKTEWVSDGEMLAWIAHPETGDTWCETYTFNIAEKVEW